MCGKEPVKWSEWLIPSVAAIAGVVAGLVATLLTTGFLEERKLTQQRQSEAVAAYLQSAWGGTAEADGYEFIRKLSLLSVYAPPETLEKIRDYNNSGCAEQNDQEEKCRSLWVSVVAELREAVGVEPVEEKTVKELLWGS